MQNGDGRYLGRMAARLARPLRGAGAVTQLRLAWSSRQAR